MTIDIAMLWLTGGIALLAILRFAPAAVLIVGAAAVLAGPSLQKVMEERAKAVTCSTDTECMCLHGGDGYGER